MRIQSKNVWIEEEFKPQILELEGETIKKILPYKDREVDLDVGENLVLPGFIDIHDHGYGGSDANNATEEFLKKWSIYLTSEGVTSFYPTTSTIAEDKLLNAFKTISTTMKEKLPGARIQGIHSEGVFLSEEKKGAHDSSLLMKPAVEKFKKWQEIANGSIKMLSFAPEVDEDYSLVKYASKNGVVVSIAHSNATFEEAENAIQNGATNFTHLFNAMTGLHHRNPGVVGSGLSNDAVYAELICDGIHVHYSVGKIAARLKGKDRLIAITDSVAMKGLKPGIYKKPGMGTEITIHSDGTIRLEDGTLAGSVAKLNDMVHNLVYKMDQPYNVAINAVTKNPAALLGIDNKFGVIKAGHASDIVVTTEKFEVLKTIVGSKIIFEK